MKRAIMWLLSRLIYYLITAGALGALGLLNTITEMYLIEH